MSSDTRGPRWWQLYALIPAVVALFAAESELSLSQTVHQVLEAGIVVVVFVFVQLWLTANRHALMEAERRQIHQLDPRTASPARRLVTDRTEVEAPAKPMFHLPPAGLRHTLEDTFDLDVPENDTPDQKAR